VNSSGIASHIRICAILGSRNGDKGGLALLKRDSRPVSHELCHKACRVLLFSALCLFVAVVFAAGEASQQAAGNSVQSTSPPTATALSSEVSKYVGAETCKTCHEEIYSAWEKTPHWKTTLNIKGGPSKQGCEGCHGPGAHHVAGGGDKSKIFVFEGKSRRETSARCLTCHGEAHEQSHFAESSHSSSDIGCLDCHSPHHAKEKEFLLVQEQPQLCYGCHT
jgi:predicted CXXCH cytochrome family protein